MQFARYKSDYIKSQLNKAFEAIDQRSHSFQRALMEVVYDLYPKNFTQEAVNLMQNTDNPKIYAMTAEYLLRHDESPFSKDEIISLMKDKFTDWQNDAILFMLHSRVSNEFQQKLPNVQELLKHDFGEKNTVIFSFQRKDRNYPGITIVRKPNGSFLRNDNGEIFYISHLAKSMSELPSYLTNGNSPKGIYSLQGIGYSDNVFIGPSPNLQMRMPYEADPKNYFHGAVKDTSWKKEYYSNLLPESWKNYLPVYEAYYAGKAGRTEIIAHGTTIDPAFHRDKAYYPNTPSLGCLTAVEKWSPKTGRLEESNQIKFMNALKKANPKKGFFILIELNDKKEQVSLEEIKLYLN
jgi:hypothetical protein